MVLTAKHHDGFALWPSRWGNFSTRQHAGGRDLLRPYVDGLRAAGLKVTWDDMSDLSDATPLLARRSHYVSQCRGGFGAVREACDLLMFAQGTLEMSGGLSI